MNILQDEKVCYLSGRDYDLVKHHIFRGADRKTADKNGFWVWLNQEWHTGQYGIHKTGNEDLLKALQKEAQKKYEETHTREEFMNLFGRSNL